MPNSQYSLILGRTIELSLGKSIYGNVFHLYSGRRFTLVSGEAVLTLQQAAVKGTSGQMEVLSPAMSLNSSGELDWVFPSSKMEIKISQGQSIDIAPGYAYGWAAVQESVLIETPLPESYPYEEVTKSVANLHLESQLDVIDFDLGIGKHLASDEEVLPTLDLSEKPSPPDKQDAPPPPKQRFYKRALLSGFAYLGMLVLILILLTVTIGNTNLTSFSLLYIIILMTILYLGYTEVRDLYEQKPLLCIISDGVVITNRLYRDMPMRWQDLQTINIESKSGLMNSSHLKICMTPHNPQFPIDYLKPEYRLIYNYMCKLKFTPPIPLIQISELDLEESLTQVYDDLKTLHTESIKHSRQLSS